MTPPQSKKQRQTKGRATPAFFLRKSHFPPGAKVWYNVKNRGPALPGSPVPPKGHGLSLLVYTNRTRSLNEPNPRLPPRER